MPEWSDLWTTRGKGLVGPRVFPRTRGPSHTTMIALALAALILVVAFTAFIVWAAVTPPDEMLEAADKLEEWGERMIREDEEHEIFWNEQQFYKNDWATMKRKWGLFFAMVFRRDPRPYLIEPYSGDEEKWERLREPTRSTHMEDN